jgi:hypothetical protein
MQMSRCVIQRLAGDAVHVAPVSSQIPCKQGILQEKSDLKAPPPKQETTVPQGFSADYLIELTGKFFRGTGNSKRKTGICREVFKQSV